MDGSDSQKLDSNEESLISCASVVFQCESCRTILGDATNWVAPTEALEVFTLSAVTERVGVGDLLQHSTQSTDAGSSFYILICKTCKAEVGRKYITTPSNLDHLRDNFTFFVSLMTSYQLGSASVKAMSKVKDQDQPLLLKVAEKVVKLQHLIVTLSHRVSAIESVLKDDEADGSDSTSK